MAECQDEFTQEIVSDEDKTKSCDSCSFRGIDNPADKYCSVCAEYLCISCVEIHVSFKATRTHELVQIGESIETANRRKVPVTNIMICDIHWSKTVSEFCVTHKKAICRLCKRSKHRKCDTKDLWQAAEENKDSIQSFIEDVKLLSSDFEEIKSSIYSIKSQFLEKTTEIRADIKKTKEEIIIWAEKLEKGAVEEIEKIERDMVSNIDSHIAVSDDMINQLELVTTSLEKLDLDRNCVEALAFKAKSERQIQEGKELKHDIQREISPYTCNFRKSDKLSTLISEVSSFGTIETMDSRFIDFTDISIVKKKADIPVGSRYITGCVFLSNGQLVICDNSNNTVKILTSEFKQKDEIKCGSRVEDIAELSGDEVIVTKTDSKCLDVLNVSGTLRKVKSIPVGELCWGVDTKNSKIYVSCHLNEGKGGNIKILTLDGVCLNTFWIDEGYPYYLAVNDTGDRIIVCTGNTSKVQCIDMTGNTIFTYSDSKMKYSLGLLFDTNDNFMICSGESNNIHVVKKDGTKHKILLSSDDGLCSPYCLAYSSADKTLVVGQYSKKSLVSFSVEV